MSQGTARPAAPRLRTKIAGMLSLLVGAAAIAAALVLHRSQPLSVTAWWGAFGLTSVCSGAVDLLGYPGRRGPRRAVVAVPVLLCAVTIGAGIWWVTS